MTYDKELKDFPATFDPEKSEKLREVFRNPKARALWMAYRGWHIVDQYTSESLPVNCLEIAEEIDNITPKEIKGKDFVQPLLSDELAMTNKLEEIKSMDDAALARWLGGRLLVGSHWGTYDSFARGQYPEGNYTTNKVLARMAGAPLDEKEELADSFRFAVFIRPYLLGEKVATYKIIEEEKVTVK